MTSKFEHLRALAEQLSQNDEDRSDWEWHSFMRFQTALVEAGILRHRPPTNNHLRELTRLAIGIPMNAPRTVAARWAKRTAGLLSKETTAS